MFVAVRARANARSHRKVMATSKAGRRAFGANAVFGRRRDASAERSSAATWANRGYSQASMYDHVEDVRSLKDSEKHWRDLPAVKPWEFRIPTTNAQRIKRPKYRLSNKTEWDFVDSLCKELLAARAIRESQLPYNIPAVCPPKKADDDNWTGTRTRWARLRCFSSNFNIWRRCFGGSQRPASDVAPGKGCMDVRHIAFLGHWVDGEGVFPQHSNVEAVVKMPPPTDVAGLRRFLGMVCYCGKYIEQMVVKRKPLTKLTGKIPTLLTRAISTVSNIMHQRKECGCRRYLPAAFTGMAFAGTRIVHFDCDIGNQTRHDVCR
eukprot:jgi/Tetstr1/466274/TSEL_000954.t1